MREEGSGVEVVEQRKICNKSEHLRFSHDDDDDDDMTIKNKRQAESGRKK